MKPPFKLGWADYALVALTCLMVLFFFDRWNAPMKDWLKTVTQPDPAPRPVPPVETAPEPQAAPSLDIPLEPEDRR